MPLCIKPSVVCEFLLQRQPSSFEGNKIGENNRKSSDENENTPFAWRLAGVSDLWRCNPFRLYFTRSQWICLSRGVLRSLHSHVVHFLRIVNLTLFANVLSLEALKPQNPLI